MREGRDWLCCYVDDNCVSTCIYCIYCIQCHDCIHCIHCIHCNHCVHIFNTLQYTKIHKTNLYITSVPCFHFVLTVCERLRVLSNLVPLTVEIDEFHLILYKVESHQEMTKGLIGIQMYISQSNAQKCCRDLNGTKATTKMPFSLTVLQLTEVTGELY